MGNGRSCFAVNSGIPAAGTAKVFGPHGGAARDVETPVTAAEVMLEAPGHVVARAEEVARTRRASGILLAEEELRAGEAYLLVPASRKRSRLTDRQMDVVLEALGRRNNNEAKKMTQQALSDRRLFPEAADEDEAAEDEVRKIEALAGLAAKGACGRGHGRRQWRPTLDTIRESRAH